MPFLNRNPKCSICDTEESELWEKTESGAIVCDKCYEARRTVGDQESAAQDKSTAGDQEPRQSAEVGPSSSITDIALTDSRSNTQTNRLNLVGSKESFESKSSTRKSARIRPSKSKSQTAIKAQPTKGRSRRVIFKKKPVKAPSSSATVITSNHIFYKGFYWQVGDVVSVVDDDDGCTYYAQIRGFLQDPYNEKSAIITWLIPTASSPASEFEASTYILGPEEDVPRKMEYFEFVSHAPSDYFHTPNASYTAQSASVEPGFISFGLKTGIQPSFGSLPAPDELDDGIYSVGARLPMNKAALGRKVRDSTKRLATAREKKPK